MEALHLRGSVSQTPLAAALLPLSVAWLHLHGMTVALAGVPDTSQKHILAALGSCMQLTHLALHDVRVGDSVVGLCEPKLPMLQELQLVALRPVKPVTVVRVGVVEPRAWPRPGPGPVTVGSIWGLLCGLCPCCRPSGSWLSTWCRWMARKRCERPGSCKPADEVEACWVSCQRDSVCRLRPSCGRCHIEQVARCPVACCPSNEAEMCQMSRMVLSCCSIASCQTVLCCELDTPCKAPAHVAPQQHGCTVASEV